MSFEPKLVGPDDPDDYRPTDETQPQADLLCDELPDDLAELADQLAADADRLTTDFPAHDKQRWAPPPEVPRQPAAGPVSSVGPLYRASAAVMIIFTGLLLAVWLSAVNAPMAPVGRRVPAGQPAQKAAPPQPPPLVDSAPLVELEQPARPRQPTAQPQQPLGFPIGYEVFEVLTPPEQEGYLDLIEDRGLDTPSFSI